MNIKQFKPLLVSTQLSAYEFVIYRVMLELTVSRHTQLRCVYHILTALNLRINSIFNVYNLNHRISYCPIVMCIGYSKQVQLDRILASVREHRSNHFQLNFLPNKMPHIYSVEQ